MTMTMAMTATMMMMVRYNYWCKPKNRSTPPPHNCSPNCMSNLRFLAYIHTHMHTYIHACIHTYIHPSWPKLILCSINSIRKSTSDQTKTKKNKSSQSQIDNRAWAEIDVRDWREVACTLPSVAIQSCSEDSRMIPFKQTPASSSQSSLSQSSPLLIYW
jgi:hypothetical protein